MTQDAHSDHQLCAKFQIHHVKTCGLYREINSMSNESAGNDQSPSSQLSGCPRSGKKSGKKNFFKVREF